MQAGLATKQLIFRDALSSHAAPLPARATVYVLAHRAIGLSLAA